MIKKIAVVVTLCTLLGFAVTNNFRELVIGKLENYANNYPEKIYVQTDKPYYTTGDDIWYTAYLVNGITHQKSNISRVLYVELVNEQDSILSKRQLFTADVSVAGDFKIKKEWESGTYLLRAYTNNMRNDSADYFFQTQIPIWNVTENHSQNKISSVTTNTTKTVKTRTISPPEIGFYPESGYLVNGLNTKVGIKVKDQAYQNSELKGTIKDSNNKIVTSFSTFKFGLSVVTLKPEANNTYYASIIFNGEEVKYPLPTALPNGYNLSMVNSGDQILVQATSNTGVGLKNTFLVAHQRGHLIYERLETEDKTNYNVKINTAALKDGVVSFTLFNSSGNPVCERLVYVDSQLDEASINLTLDNEAPKTRDKVSMEIDLSDKNGQPLSGNLSMSITDIDAIGQSAQSENIKTYLLLNSDIRGSIENPGYFFQKENDIKRRYLLDVLMLTHGWRRFTWHDLLYKHQEKKRYTPEKGIFISGSTRSLNGTKQPIQSTTRITFMGSLPYQEKKQTDVKGIFNYGPFIFNDTLPILLEARVKDFKSDNDKKNRLVSITLTNKNLASPRVMRNDILKSTLQDSSKINSFLKQAKNIFQIDAAFAKSARVLDEIVITAQRETEEEQREQELNDRTDYGYASKRLDMKSLENQSHLSIFNLLNMLPGVTTVNDSIYIRNQAPAVYLDGFQVELDDLTHLTGNDIDFIDVLSGAEAFTFNNGGNGVVAIYSRTGINISVRNVKRKPGIIDFESIGFYTAREFYAPDHLNGFDEAMKADMRTTLHWEPKIVLNENNIKAKISFFTSDKKSNYAIKIEGLTDSGIPVYHLSTLEVD
ncbi:MAG: hypothetical protein ABJM36_02410 [Algibacter sp.]|uniref:hypothetical protein n=1 Tax=Algibacter sp. TaxID=1872428 RepID=UPI003297570F